MRKWNLPGFGFQAFLLRAALVSLPLILVLSLLATVAEAAGQGSVPITIKYHGKTTRTSVAPGSVSPLLSRLGLELSGEDVVSHGMDDSITEDMELVIDRMITTRETYTAAIPYAVSVCWDSSIPQGVEEVLVKGCDGELRCTANVTYKNGRETEREVICQEVIRPAVTEVVAQGTGRREMVSKTDGPIIADGYITMPTGEVLTYTEVRTVTASAYSHMDKGCDNITATGTTVHWGTVAVNPKHIPYGTRMFITSSDGGFVYGIATAEDHGGSIGKDRIDLYMPSYHECIQFGRRECTVYFLG